MVLVGFNWSMVMLLFLIYSLSWSGKDLICVLFILYSYILAVYFYPSELGVAFLYYLFPSSISTTYKCCCCVFDYFLRFGILSFSINFLNSSLDEIDIPIYKKIYVCH